MEYIRIPAYSTNFIYYIKLLLGKLQAAGYKQAIEKWDSDSDSDASDDEDLKV